MTRAGSRFATRADATVLRDQHDALERLGLDETGDTFASFMIAAGVNAKALCTYMVHATISIPLDRYGHLMPANESDAAGPLDARLARRVPARCRSCGDPRRFGATRGESIAHG